MKDKTILSIFSLVLSMGALIWLSMIDWRVALCVYCLFWGNNIQKTVISMGNLGAKGR